MALIRRRLRVASFCRKKALVKELNGFVLMRKTFNSGLSQGQTVKLSADGRAAEVVVPTESIAGG